MVPVTIDVVSPFSIMGILEVIMHDSVSFAIREARNALYEIAVELFNFFFIPWVGMTVSAL